MTLGLIILGVALLAFAIGVLRKLLTQLDPDDKLASSNSTTDNEEDPPDDGGMNCW